MIFTYGYFEKNKLPKFYAGVAKMMESVNNSVFMDDDDIRRLHAMIVRQLEKDKPAGSTAHVDLFYCNGGKSGGIYVIPSAYAADNVALRLMFDTVSHLLHYDEPTGHFAYGEIGFLMKKGGEA